MAFRKRLRLFSYREGAGEPGKTLGQCPNCNKEFIDPRYYELAICGISTFTYSKIPGIFFIVFGSVVVICSILFFRSMDVESAAVSKYFLYFVQGLFLLAGGAIAIAGIRHISSINDGSLKQQYEKELLESRRRMTDRNYVRKLLDLGERLPGKLADGTIIEKDSDDERF